MNAMITITAILFVLSIAAMVHAFSYSSIAESGQIGSIILLAGCIGTIAAIFMSGIVVGMLIHGR